MVCGVFSSQWNQMDAKSAKKFQANKKYLWNPECQNGEHDIVYHEACLFPFSEMQFYPNMAKYSVSPLH